MENFISKAINAFLAYGTLYLIATAGGEHGKPAFFAMMAVVFTFILMVRVNKEE